MISKLEETPVLRFNPTTLQDVRAEFELDQPGRMDEAIDLLEDWLRKQEHFVTKEFPREYLERRIISAKGSVETVKRRLDKLCTLRTTVPNLFETFDPHRKYPLDAIVNVNMPRLTADHHRVFVVRFTGAPLTPDMLRDAYHYNLIISEYLKRHDYSKGVDLIFDVMGIELLNLLTNIPYVDFRNFMTIFLDGMGFRLRSINIMSVSKMTDALVAVFKQVLSEKLVKRIKVHKSMESLHESLPRHLLPEEYGGNEKSIAILFDNLVTELSSKEHVEYFNAMRLARTDESRRAPAAFNQHCLGMPGSFRTLTVD